MGTNWRLGGAVGNTELHSRGLKRGERIVERLLKSLNVHWIGLDGVVGYPNSIFPSIQVIITSYSVLPFLCSIYNFCHIRWCLCMVRLFKKMALPGGVEPPIPKENAI
jgi:hypothetical protein